MLYNINTRQFSDKRQLIDHKKLLRNFEKIEVRPVLIAWFRSYFQGRSKDTKFGNTFSDSTYIKGGKVGKISPFIVHINDFPSVDNSSHDNSDSMFEVLNVFI